MTTASIWDDTKQRARPLSRGNTYGIKLFRHGGSDLLLVVVVAQASCESKKPNKGIFQNTMRTLSPFFHVNISSTFGCTYPACMGNRYIENRGMEEEPESLCKRRTTDANSGIVCVVAIGLKCCVDLAVETIDFFGGERKGCSFSPFRVTALSVDG